MPRKTISLRNTIYKRSSCYGSEGTGISRGVWACVTLVSIPQLGEIGSLNVSTTAVVLYEARQRLAKTSESEE